MTFSSQQLRVAAAAVTLAIGIVGCHGQSPGNSGYVPAAGSAAVSAPQGGSGLAQPDAKQKIVSSCGKKVHIVLAGILDCKFREQGYGNGTLTITNNTNGIVIITPSSGTQKTTFTIVGALVGSGNFVVKDTKGHSLRVRVRVTL